MVSAGELRVESVKNGFPLPKDLVSAKRQDSLRQMLTRDLFKQVMVSALLHYRDVLKSQPDHDNVADEPVIKVLLKNLEYVDNSG